MPASTLVKMATRQAIRVVSQINDVAEMPYELARPILLKIQSPQQLRDIEVNCPHVTEADAELWQAFIARDIPDWENKIVEPRNQSSWHKVYLMLQRREQRKAAEDEEKLRKTLQGEDRKKAEKEVLFVQKALPHARGTSSAYVDGVPRKDVGGWGQKRAPSLKNAKTGTDRLLAIRRQAADASRSRALQTAKPIQTPAQKLANAKRQITQAPARLIQESKRPLTIAPRELHPHEQEMMFEMEAARAAKRIQPPSRTNNATVVRQMAVEAAARKARADNEAKLKALTQSHKRATSESAKSTPRAENDAKPKAAAQAARREPPASSPPERPPRSSVTPSTTAVRPTKRLSPPPQRRAQDVASGPKSDRTTTVSSTRKPEVAAKHDVPSAKPSLPDSRPVATAKSTSPEPSPPPKMTRKRPAASIFMNANKKRKT